MALQATVNSEIGATKIVASNKKEFLKYEEAYSCLDRWLPRIYDGSARELSAKPSPEQRDRLLPLMRKILIGMCSNVSSAASNDWLNLANVIAFVGVPPLADAGHP